MFFGLKIGAILSQKTSFPIQLLGPIVMMVPQAPRPHRSIVMMVPEGPRPHRSIVMIVPQGPRPHRSIVMIVPQGPRPNRSHSRKHNRPIDMDTFSTPYTNTKL